MNKLKVTEQILRLMHNSESTLQRLEEPYFKENAETFQKNLERIKASFSGSWLGYHANVYYEGFNAPVPGDNFSVEWGFMNPFGSRKPRKWREVRFENVQEAMLKGVDQAYEQYCNDVAVIAENTFHDAHNGLTALIAVLEESKRTAIIQEMGEEVRQIKGKVSPSEFISQVSPKGQVMSRDMNALTRGNIIPPHISIQARHFSWKSPFNGLVQIVKLANKLRKYMEMHDLIEVKPMKSEGKIFLGHGNSPLWRELKDFLETRLQLGWDEFNREPSAGLPTQERLENMLDEASFAFLIMTGENQHEDQSLHARENVIHEVGLFQGRLGFRRAIVLLEKDCSEFANIHGLTQIRFPKGNIEAIFEEIRKVLEREGIIKQ